MRMSAAISQGASRPISFSSVWTTHGSLALCRARHRTQVLQRAGTDSFLVELALQLGVLLPELAQFDS